MRVLWLMNHTTLRKFEVPLLQKYGFEVFLPKIFPYDEGNLSASVTYEYDSGLSIPEEELQTLNRHDFYSGISSEIKDIINRRFDIAFFGFFPDQLAALVRNFDGVLVMRPFGLANGVTYGRVTEGALGHYFFHEIEKIGERFWFGQAYSGISDEESGIFHKRAVHLPVGLANALREKTWTGGNGKILFVCPRIGSSPYFNYIYREFCKNFEGLPYSIGGAQPIAVEDANVTGFLERAGYDEMMKCSDVMFYHSTERNHIHYHPFEAISVGMPLVFMAGGLLDSLGGVGLPGRCENVAEARLKIERILGGDQNLVKSILKTQDRLLDPMSYDSCKEVWDRNFFKILQQAEEIKNTKPLRISRKKVGVILPEAYRGGTLDVVKLLARMLQKGARDRGEDVEVIFAHPAADFYSDEDFMDLKADGIARRQISWDVLSTEEFSRVATILNRPPVVSDNIFVAPNDGGNYLLDCDFWFLTSDRIPQLLAPLRPYAIFSHDYLQRYFPSLMGSAYEKSFIENARGAVVVLANTPHTIEDCIGYVGIPKSRVVMVPHVVDLDKHSIDIRNVFEKYFIWTTNAGPHKNQIRCLEAFERYFAMLGSESLGIHVTGVNTHYFNPDVEYGGNNHQIKIIRDFLADRPLLRVRMKFMGELNNYSYSQEIANAKFLFHNVVMDNGTLCAVEAAYYGVPTVSSDYPPMRYISERYFLNCRFFDALSVDDAAGALVFATKNHDQLRKFLPDRDRLEMLSWRKMSQPFWELLRTYI